MKMKLIAIAGCNGVGKSTYGRNLIKSFIDADDFIYIDLDIVANLIEKNNPNVSNVSGLVQNYFKTSINDAILEKKHFVYETNLRKNPFDDINSFTQAGYEKILLFLTLESVEKSLERVHFRIANEKGNFVSDTDVIENFKLGLIQLNDCFRRGEKYFNTINIFECDNDIPLLSVSINDKTFEYVRVIPKILKSQWTQLIHKSIEEFCG
jgi:predicted ABC-type ATPase